MTKTDLLIDYLKENIIPAFGCTDPVTPALAASIAYKKIGGDLVSIRATVSDDIYKGAHSVYLPGTKHKGLTFALVMGTLMPNPDKGLMLLQDVTDDYIAAAEELIKDVEISLTSVSDKGEIFTDVKLTTTSGTSEVIFKGRHDKPTAVIVNGRMETSAKGMEDFTSVLPPDYLNEMSTAEIIHLSDDILISKISFLDEALKLNREASIAGLSGHYGISFGRNLDNISVKRAGEISEVRTACTAAADLRMGGGKMPIMSLIGSGNQGILLFASIDKFTEFKQMSSEKRLRGAFCGAILAAYMNYLLGDGTPFCDCALIASAALSGAVAYLLGGGEDELNKAVQLTCGSLFGLLCDGAKGNCAQKIALGSGCAVENAYIAVESKTDVEVAGIIGKTVSETFINIKKLGSKIRKNIESEIVAIVSERS